MVLCHRSKFTGHASGSPTNAPRQRAPVAHKFKNNHHVPIHALRTPNSVYYLHYSAQATEITVINTHAPRMILALSVYVYEQVSYSRLVCRPREKFQYWAVKAVNLHNINFPKRPRPQDYSYSKTRC